MGFTKTTQEERGEPFNIDNQNDKRVVLEFEKELAPYEQRVVTVLAGYGRFERNLSGFELYLHENGIFRYSQAYPTGSFVVDKLPEYRFLRLKYGALCKLRERREFAKGQESARVESLESNPVAAGV